MDGQDIPVCHHILSAMYDPECCKYMGVDRRTRGHGCKWKTYPDTHPLCVCAHPQAKALARDNYLLAKIEEI